MIWKLRCRGCGLQKQIEAPAYPWPRGSLLPVEGFGQRACCVRCGKAQLEILNAPEEPPPAKPKGWAA